MSRFSSLLNSINDRLDVPQPKKSRILIEIAADLQDAYDFYREQGKSEREATQLAQEKFILDDSTISELSSIHQPLVKKWMDTISLNVQSRWERIILILTLLSIAAFSGRVMLTNSFFERSSIFVWPIWAVFTAGIIQFFIKFYRLYLLKDHDSKNLRKGIDVIAYLAVFGIFLGFAGYFYELLFYSIDTIIPGGSLITVLVTVTDSLNRIRDITTCFTTSATVMMASLFSGMFLALLWYILNKAAAKIEIAEANSLLGR